LLEDVIEHILEIEDVRLIATVDELCSHMFVGARHLVVGNPELRGATASRGNWRTVN
jgi:hypothetical protein